jgi:hypothetical protein
MKKGLYYLPIILVSLIGVGVSYYLNNWVSLCGWVLSTCLVFEVYYLRFLK